MTAALLFELAWKSGLLAGAALLAAALLRARPAAERVAVLRLGVVMIFTLPLLAVLTPALRIDAPAFMSRTGRPVTAAPLAPTPLAAEVPAVIPAPRPAAVAAPVDRPAAPVWTFDPGLAAVSLWALGAALLLLRLGAGVAMLHRLTRRAEPVSDPRWLSALDQAALRGPRPILRASSRIPSPLSWGVRPAVILLNPAALAQAGRADAVLTHEMGHVRHGDWLFLMLTRLLVAVLWFNPLVWLLQRELGRQSEQAADAWALRRIGRIDYASALVALAARGRPHAALGMAAAKGDLARRITAIMTTSSRRGGPWPTALAIATCVGLATPLAAVELEPRKIAPILGLTLPLGAPVPVQTDSGSAPSAPRTAPMKTAPASGDPARRETVLHQREQGLAMMEDGARMMESQARAMRTEAAILVDPDDRADLLADADELDREAADLRREARELAVRDWTELRPMTPEDEQEFFVNTNVNTSISINTAGAQADVDAQMDPNPDLTAEERAEMAAGLREGAREMRLGATDLEAGADEIEQNEPPEDRRRFAFEMRKRADEMWREADAMDARADAVR